MDLEMWLTWWAELFPFEPPGYCTNCSRQNKTWLRNCMANLLLRIYPETDFGRQISRHSMFPRPAVMLCSMERVNGTWWCLSKRQPCFGWKWWFLIFIRHKMLDGGVGLSVCVVLWCAREWTGVKSLWSWFVGYPEIYPTCVCGYRTKSKCGAGLYGL